MIRNDEVQAEWVRTAKANANILAQLNDNNEIREDQWQGAGFSYPAIRVNQIVLSPIKDHCDKWEFRTSFEVYSEEASSQQADRIAGIIGGEYHNTAYTSNGIRFYRVLVAPNGLLSAIREDDRTWRSEVVLVGSVQ